MPQDGLDATVRKLKTRPGIVRWLEQLHAEGRSRRPTSGNSAAAARRMGLTEDVVAHKAPPGRWVRMPVSKAMEELGSDWYRLTQSTDLECLTPLGHQILGLLPQVKKAG